jgi:polysaccharide export outer membrane protein
MRNILLKDGDSIYVDSGIERDRLAYDEAQLSASLAANARDAFKDRVDLGAVERGYAYLAGEVRRAHRYPLPFETRAYMADVLFDKDGIPIREGDYSEIYLLRAATRPEEAGGVTAYHLNASNAVNLAVASQMELRPGDIVFVAEHPVTAWNRVISQITPTIFIQAANAAGI